MAAAMRPTSELSVRELQEELRRAGVSSADCLEKSDLRAKVEIVRSRASAANAARPSAPRRPAAAPARPSASSSGVPLTLEASAELRRLRSAGRDHYAVLGVKKTASPADIKKAYRRLALVLHPDKCGSAAAEEAFKKVSRAWDVLSDPEKREDYDRWGDDSDQPQSHARHAQDFAHADFVNVNHFFSGATWGGRSPRRRGRRPRGGAVHVNLPAWLVAMVTEIPPGLIPLIIVILLPVLLGVVRIALSSVAYVGPLIPFAIIFLAVPQWRQFLLPFMMLAMLMPRQ
eukprot:TRINITY_DN10587_c0_g1_i1.p2 TRINITY_DN10587_c0_g1~~TRINITY_DN10587_c0_g1_i1.p2  ORF type:complete len:313 (+),score=92.17 TRINITY_DN10587_c0_g1_i1:79-939(+)